jgi:hypothetical protein
MPMPAHYAWDRLMATLVISSSNELYVGLSEESAMFFEEGNRLSQYATSQIEIDLD